jgi:hypothetical protein
MVTRNGFTVDPRFGDKYVVHVEFLIKDKTVEKPNLVTYIGPCNGGMIADMDDSTPFRCVWAIEATTPISAKEFVLIPGIIPDGFEQLIPNKENQFIPSKGQEYHVLICLDPVEDSDYIIGQKWTSQNISSN